MITIYISLLPIVFLAGFQLGKAYIIKGLSLRINQLYEDGDHSEAKLFAAILSKDKK